METTRKKQLRDGIIDGVSSIAGTAAGVAAGVGVASFALSQEAAAQEVSDDEAVIEDVVLAETTEAHAQPTPTAELNRPSQGFAPNAHSESNHTTGIQPDTEAAIEQQPESESVDESQLEPESVTESLPESETAVDNQVEPELSAVIEQGAEPSAVESQNSPEVVIEQQAVPESDVALQSAPEDIPESEIAVELQSAPEPVLEPQAMSESVMDAQPASEQQYAANIEVLDYRTVSSADGSQSDVAVMSIDGETVTLTDVDQNGYADLLATDFNHNGQVEENEVVDITGSHIQMQPLADAAGNNVAQAEQLDPNGHQYADGQIPDYINDANVGDYMA